MPIVARFARVVLVVMSLVACRHDARHEGGSPAPAPIPAPTPSASAFVRVVELHVPHISAPIVVNGETDDRGWLDPPGPARTGAFQFANGAVARPYSEARLVWNGAFLFLTLYAADEDIESRTDRPDGPLWLDDSFRVTFRHETTEYLIEVSPEGVVSDAIRKSGGAYDYGWSSGVRVGHDTDGTINDPSDMDEEWVIEMAIPFASLGLKGEPGEHVGLSLHRCDTPKGSPRTCEGWGEGVASGALVLDR